MRAYIGLGSNLGDREAMLTSAVGLLRADADIEVLGISTFRVTDPVGNVDQPRFLNGAVAVETTLSAGELLDRLLAIERTLGRTRDGEQGGPRTIDLDLLLYGDEVVHDVGLTVPHPRLSERRFALEPLHDLDPGLTVPGAGPLEALLSGLE